MFTLTQVQYIFDYGMCAFYQCAEKTRPEAVKRVAQVAGAATTMVNKEAKMAAQTKNSVMGAGLESVMVNKHLTGEQYKKAFDIQFAISMKSGLEKLFEVENLLEYDKTNNKPPVFPTALVAPVKVDKEVPDPSEITTTKPTSKFRPQFFTPGDELVEQCIENVNTLKSDKFSTGR